MKVFENFSSLELYCLNFYNNRSRIICMLQNSYIILNNFKLHDSHRNQMILIIIIFNSAFRNRTKQDIQKNKKISFFYIYSSITSIPFLLSILDPDPSYTPSDVMFFKINMFLVNKKSEKKNMLLIFMINCVYKY